jgi:hypothetical protein
VVDRQQEERPRCHDGRAPDRARKEHKRVLGQGGPWGPCPQRGRTVAFRADRARPQGSSRTRERRRPHGIASPTIVVKLTRLVFQLEVEPQDLEAGRLPARQGSAMLPKMATFRRPRHNRTQISESCRRVDRDAGVSTEARSPQDRLDLEGLRWLRGSDLNRRPLGYEPRPACNETRQNPTSPDTSSGPPHSNVGGSWAHLGLVHVQNTAKNPWYGHPSPARFS